MMLHLVPDPPSGVQSLSITSTSASITWEAPVALINTPISDIEHYELMVYEYVHNLPTIFANTTELTYTFTGLEEFVNYTCKVLAFNRVGRGQYSTAFNFSTQQAGNISIMLCVRFFQNMYSLTIFQLQAVPHKM